MNCPNCTTVNRDTARFCRRCGIWLEKKCPNCGERLPDIPTFCDQCGYQVSPLPAAGRQWADGVKLEDPGYTDRAADRARPGSRDYGEQAAEGAADGQPMVSAPRSPVPDPQSKEAPQALSPIQKYLPKELMAKLEAARASGAMAGERRIVTMLFCDVKGSTAAAEHLDPEEWTEIINGAFEHMIKPVYHYEGTVARLMGDAILAFFGAPIAHEDDPQRAILAGLEIVADIQGYREAVGRRYGIDFNVRVGINTGMVVVGAVGSDLRMEYTAMGDAINLAARMEQTAQPGTVQIAHDTYKQVAPLFEFEALGGIEVKGKEEPVPAYRVLGRKSQAVQLRGIGGEDGQLVGRTRELVDLQEALAKLQRGVGGIVCLIGEAGLGKSRLIRELKKTLPEGNGVSWFATSSLSYETSQPYNLFRRLIRRVAGAAPDDPPEALREKIATIFKALDLADEGQMRRAFESLFGLPGAGGEPPLEGETFRQLFISATRALWQERARQRPTVLACDDLHWADSASVELLKRLFGLTETVPLLIVCSFRPERGAPGWGLKSAADAEFLHRYTEVLLKPLSKGESQELLNNLTLSADIPGEARQRILEKAAGVPYYIEEVVRSLIESQTLAREDGHYRWAAGVELADIDLPDTLQSLLVSRIDRLQEDARRTLQLASVIGRSFYYRVLAQIEDAASAIDERLSQLVRVNMIREAAREPELEYAFSNVLTQEAAYQTLLLRHRRQFHRQVGEALESLFPDRQDELAPVLALHFSEGGDEARALKYLTLAGDAAFRIYALDEAVDHYGRALEIALRGGDEVQPSSLQLRHLYTRLGRSYEHLYQYEHVRETYEAMRQEAESRGDKALELAYLLALGTVRVTHSPLNDPEHGRALAEKALALAQEVGDRRAEAKARWNLLLLHRSFTGDLEAARENGEASLAIARDLDWEEQLAFALNDLSFVYTATGGVTKTVEMLEEAQALWRKNDNLPMLTDNLNVSATMYIVAGELERSVEMVQEGIQLADAINSYWNKPPLYIGLSRAYLEMGKLGPAIESIYKARESEQPGWDPDVKAWHLSAVPMTHYNLGQVEAGLELCRQGLELVKDSEPAFSRLAETYSAMQALLYIAGEDPDAARKSRANVHPDPDAPIVFPFIDLFLVPVACRVDLALGKNETALEMSARFVATLEGAGARFTLADGYFYQGQALRGLGRPAEAREALVKARKVAEEIGVNRILWEILGALAEMEEEAGKAAEAEALWEQARAAVAYVADHAGSEENRASFLGRREVRSLMTKVSRS